MKWRESPLVLLVLFSLLCLGCGSSEVDVKPNPDLQNALFYLNDLPGVAWVKYRASNVYIGFYTATKSDELRDILTVAAMRGNRAIELTCQVWGVAHDEKVPSPQNWYGYVLVRYQKVEKIDIRR
jgi:hypothetical protein